MTQRPPESEGVMTIGNCRIDVSMRILGSALVIIAYFIILHVSTTLGVVVQTIGDGISIPYFIRTKSWDVVIMVTFILIISLSHLL